MSLPLIAGVAAGGAMLYYGFQSKDSQITQLELDIVKLKQENQETQREKSKLAAMEDQLRQLKATTDKLKGFTPRDPALGDPIQRVGDILKTNTPPHDPGATAPPKMLFVGVPAVISTTPVPKPQPAKTVVPAKSLGDIFKFF